MSRTKAENKVHIGLSYDQALSGKKDILLSEENLLKIIKKMREYSLLRKREFILKGRIKKDLGIIRTSIKNIEEELPEIQEIELPEEMQEHRLPELDITLDDLKEQQEKQIHKEEIKLAETKKNTQLESELEDIQKKLAELDF